MAFIYILPIMNEKLSGIIDLTLRTRAFQNTTFFQFSKCDIYINYYVLNKNYNKKANKMFFHSQHSEYTE